MDSELKKKVLNYAYLILAKRDYTEKILVFKIRQKFPEITELSEIIEHLKSNRFLDEKRYAENVAESYARKLKGPKAAFQFLFQKGVNEKTAKEAVNQIFTEELKSELILRLIEKKFGKIKFENLSQEEKGKVYRFVVGRGFDFKI